MLELATTVRGTGPPVLLLHGFTTAAAAWAPIVERLEHELTLVCVDLPGHGRSQAPPSGYEFSDCVGDLLESLSGAGIDRCCVVGYSMGGRIALGLTVRAPDRVERLLLESASPGIDEAAARARRRDQDEALAAKIASGDFTEFIDRWMQLPLFRSPSRPAVAQLDESRRLRLRNRPAAIAASLRALGTGSQPSYWSELQQLDLPVSLLTGEHDHKFNRIADQMSELLPRCTRHAIRDAGHTTHLDRPEDFARAVRDFVLGDEASDATPAKDVARA